MQQIRRMGQGIFETQVVIEDKGGRIRRGCFEVVVEGSAIEQGVFTGELFVGTGWIGG